MKATIPEMRQEKPGVFKTEDEFVRVSREQVARLKAAVEASPRKRVRLCAHKESSAVVQEMIIVLSKNGYVCPHRHRNKCESFHVIEGRADIVIFNEDGTLHDVIRMGEAASGLAFYYRIDTPWFHTLVIHSDVFIIHETTKGPFVAGETETAEWAPAEDQVEQARAFMERLRAQLQQ